eukprot:TRINITY_DN30897_c0_g1_i1.p1 TRINITY_DN30897_c0_g1~~TRINITY_DN30897_c0_g1_i1.p1  ORF type:complete len:589 (-),score=115.29 TRINITY_DN30897_c0_g1_i1:101-1762(-)
MASCSPLMSRNSREEVHASGDSAPLSRGASPRGSRAPQFWVRAETFDHAVMNMTVRWTVSKVLDFVSSLRAAAASTTLTRNAWIEVTTTRCKPALSDSEAAAYWQLFEVMQQRLLGKRGQNVDVRLAGLALMCQVFSPHRVRADNLAKQAEMWPAIHGSQSPRASPRGSSPRTAASPSSGGASRGRDTAAALLPFVRQHIGYFLQIACFALTAEPLNITTEEFDSLGLIVTAGASSKQPLGRLSEAIPELLAKGSIPAKELRRSLDKMLVWNDEVYPSGETSSTPGEVPASCRTVNICGMSKATWKPNAATTAEVDFLNITGCNDCVVYITFPVRFCLIAGCHDCTIIMGPVTAMCTIQNCEKISVHVCAHSFKMENSIDSSFYVYTKHHPILTGDTRGIKLAPYNVLYSGMRSLLERSDLVPETVNIDVWAQPICCTLGSQDDTFRGRSGSFEESSASSTYHFVHPNSFHTVVIPEARRSMAQPDAFALPEAYGDGIRRRAVEMRNLQRQLADIGDEAKSKKAQQAIQGHFREWLQSTGKARQLADLQRLAS